MIVLRQDQLDALGVVVSQTFADRVAAHLRRHFPRQVAELGDDLRGFVEQTIERAGSYGFTTQQAVCRYAGIACVFGRDFDQRLEWPKRLLQSDADPSRRIDLLVAEARDRLSGGGGES
jgi:hypothetical protein